MRGIIFDIKEFALNDGEGIRTTVFFKGCPLRCIWCHNPEGLSAKPEIYLKKNGCLKCGLCKIGCSHEECKPYGRCLHICPMDLVSVAGKVWECEELASKLLSGSHIYKSFGGGITLSGGEPLLQSDFAYELLRKLRGKVHRAIETSGYADQAVFQKVISECDFVYMDIKLLDREAHKKYTGVSNEKILENAKQLIRSGIPHAFRIPLIPSITDTEQNLRAISDFLGDSPIELLPYNNLAPAKYESVGRHFAFNSPSDSASQIDIKIFKNATMRKS